MLLCASCNNQRLSDLQCGHDLSAVETPSATTLREGLIDLQCGHDLSAVETGPAHRADAVRLPFNAATTFRPWKPLVSRPVCDVHMPSMRPRPFGRGNWRHGGASRRPRSAFNAATTFRPWKRAEPHVDQPLRREPSMRPRPFGRGNFARSERGDQRRSPSMRPRPFGRGNAFDEWYSLYVRPEPSMRPRPFGRGNGEAVGIHRAVGDVLQCGHDLSAVETIGFGSGDNLEYLLQCGHDLSAVETDISLAQIFRAASPFNAATTFRPWKRSRRSWLSRRLWTFNAATTFRPWKRRDSRCRSVGRHLQCGHDLSAVETAGRVQGAGIGSHLQCGHDLSAVETAR